jgi:transcription termination factor Rho
MSGAALKDKRLAELHRMADELEVPGYRKLTRDELIREIDARAPEAEAATEPETAVEPTEPVLSAEPTEPEAPEAETEPITGILDRMPQGFGFLRLQGLEAGERDVYVSASQIRRCELRLGDEVAGPAREPRLGERHRALVKVESVNGREPESERTSFEDLPAVAPHRRLALEPAADDALVRAVDLLAPLALGQRILVVAEPRSGRTTLLRGLAKAVAGGGAHLIVLLADERPEEVTEWRRSLPDAEIAAAEADQEPREQVRVAELAIGHAKRRAEAGEDVVAILDSLSRLALGYRDPVRVKRLFGAGRELGEEGSGSLTMVATVLAGDDRGDDVRAALETIENVLVRLDAGLASTGITPSLVVADTRVSGEASLREPDEIEKVRGLRSELAAMDPADAARALGERLAGSKTNAELLETL